MVKIYKRIDLYTWRLPGSYHAAGMCVSDIYHTYHALHLVLQARRWLAVVVIRPILCYNIE